MEQREVVVVAINCGLRQVLLDDGTMIPITNFFDEFGDDCEPDDALVVVAGNDGFGYLTIELFEDDFGKVTLH